MNPYESFIVDFYRTIRKIGSFTIKHGKTTGNEYWIESEYHCYLRSTDKAITIVQVYFDEKGSGLFDKLIRMIHVSGKSIKVECPNKRLYNHLKKFSDETDILIEIV